MVGADLLAKAVDQSTSFSLTRRLRQQAGSYFCGVPKTRNLLQKSASFHTS